MSWRNYMKTVLQTQWTQSFFKRWRALRQTLRKQQGSWIVSFCQVWLNTCMWNLHHFSTFTHHEKSEAKHLNLLHACSHIVCYCTVPCCSPSKLNIRVAAEGEAGQLYNQWKNSYTICGMKKTNRCRSRLKGYN